MQKKQKNSVTHEMKTGILFTGRFESTNCGSTEISPITLTSFTGDFLSIAKLRTTIYKTIQIFTLD
jgi:hypothetical protein